MSRVSQEKGREGQRHLRQGITLVKSKTDRLDRNHHMPNFENQEKYFEFYVRDKRKSCVGSERASRMI